MIQSSHRYLSTVVAQFLAMLCAAAILSPGSAHSGILTGPIVNPANGNSYYLLESATWIHSQFEARQLGGDLATINDADEDEWLINNFRNFGGSARNLWIGLNDARTPDTFEWVSGEPAIYRGWADGQPDNFFGGQVYVAITPSGFLRGDGWGDQNDGTSDFLGTPYHGVVEVEAGSGPLQRDPAFAFTNFDEPADGDSDYTPGAGGSELGFRTEILAQDGANPTLGKATTSTTPTSPIFFHSSMSARTTFDRVDLVGWSNVTVTIDVAARLTTYEDGDFLRVFVLHDGNGEEEIDLIHLEGEELNQIAGLSYFSLSAELPEDWAEAQLIVESSTNSTQDAERIDIDNVAFRSPFPQGEPDVVFSGAKDLVVTASEDDDTATVDFTAISAVDGSGQPLTVTCTPTDTEPFPVGVHEVVCRATDGSGRTASTAFQLIVLESRTASTERFVSILALRKDPAPGGGFDELLPKNATFRTFNRAVLNNRGDLLFEVQLDDASTSVLYSNATGTLVPVAAATGSERDDDQRGRFWNLGLNDAGQHAFEANTSGGNTQFVGGETAAAVGDIAAGTNGAKCAQLHKPALDGSGELFTLAHLTRQPTGPEITRYNDTGLWGARGGLIAREGEPSPLEDFQYGHLFSRIVATADGQIAFATNLSPAPAAAIFAGNPNSLEAVVKSGDPAPGTDTTFDDFRSESLNSTGDLVFRATLALGGDITAANNSGLWTNRGGALELIAREGDIAPCLPADSPATFDRIADTSIGADGTIYFHAYLAGNNVDSSNDGSLWRRSPDGTLHLIAREGAPTNNAVGVYRRIASFVSNDIGGVAFLAELVHDGGDPFIVRSRALGVWLDRGDGPAPQLVLRRGDQIEVEPGEPQLITSINLDRQSNAHGGSGGYGKLLNDSGQLLVRLSLTDNLSGVFLADAPKQAALEKSLPAPKPKSKRLLPADRPDSKIRDAKLKTKSVSSSPPPTPKSRPKPQLVHGKPKPSVAAKTKTVPVAATKATKTNGKRIPSPRKSKGD